MNRDLRPMGVGQIVGAAIDLYRDRFATFLTISAVVYVPYALVVAKLLAIARSFALPPVPGGFDTSFWTRLDLPLPRWSPAASVLSSVAGVASMPHLPGLGDGQSPILAIATAIAELVGAVLFLGLVYPLCSGALMLNISASYLGENLSAGQSYGRVFQRLGRLLSAQFLVTLCVAFGILCCIVPGILASLWLMLVPAVVLLEDDTAWGALRRSRTLMAGNLGKGLLLGLVAGLLGIVWSAMGSWVLGFVPWPSTFLADFFEALLEAFTLPLTAGTMVLLYYDLRIRKEGFGLEHLAANATIMRDPRPDTLAPLERPPR